MNPSASQSGQASSSSLSPKVNGNNLIQQYLDAPYQEALARVKDKDTHKKLKGALESIRKRLRKVQDCFNESSTFRATLLSEKANIENLIKSKVNFIQASANNVTDKMMAIDLLMKQSEMLYPIFKGIDGSLTVVKDVSGKRHLHLVAEQELLHVDEEKERLHNFFEKLQEEQLSEHTVINRCFISYAWPSENHKEKEAWIQPFLAKLREDLRAADIPAELDIIDNQGGQNIYHYMDKVQESDVVLVIGTESLLEKHRQGTTAVCNELILINRARAKGNARVIPILLSGDYETSFPAYFAMYNTIDDWREKSYLNNLQELIRILCEIGQDAKAYKACWQEYLKTVPELADVLEEEQVEDYVSLVARIGQDTAAIKRALYQKRMDKLREVSKLTLSESPLEEILKQIRQKVLTQKEIENELELYIPLSGAFSAGHDAKLVDVEATVNDFLASNKKVMLLLGEAGAGKTTYGRYLERKLWEAYEPSSSQAIPLFIPLTSLQDPVHHLLEETLKRQGLSKKERLELKTQRSLILILDGYDELNKPDNLYGSNQLHEWNVKVIITCRSPYLMGVNSHRFAPIDALRRIDYSLYQEFHLKPFTSSQMESYLQKYVYVRKPEWTDWQQYQQAINEIPHLKELIETPYILYIVVEVLPSIVKKHQAHTPSLDRIRLTRADIYEAFIQGWFQKQEEKLRAQGRLTAANINIQKAFMNYAKGLASEMWKVGVNAITWQPKESCPFELEGGEGSAEARDSRWDKFFDDSTNPQLNLVRSGCPLRKQGENQWLFVHKSLQEYLGARQIFDEAGVIPTEINQKLLTDEPSMIRFLADRATTEESFKESLWRLIESSKLEESITVAAANAITILNYAGFDLNQKDLRGIRIAGADLNGASLDYANLTGADLREVNLCNAFLRGADLSGAKMAGVIFGLWPSLKHQGAVYCLCYSPDDKWLAVGVGKEIYLWDLEASQIKHTFRGHKEEITSLSFRGDGQQLASGSDDRTVKLWEVSSGRLERSLKGHTNRVTCVSYRGDGQQLASGGWDKTVKLWGVSSGRLERCLEGHMHWVECVGYRGDGQQLASGGGDGTVILWEVSSGHLEMRWKGHTDRVTCVSYREDGQQLASGSLDKTVRLWEVSSGRLERSLEGHTDPVTSVSYRGDGQQLASGGDDKMVRLWEVSSGHLQKSLKGHRIWVTCVSYRGDGQQLASGSEDGTVKLWEVSSGRLEKSLLGHTDPVTSVSYRGDGQQLASGSWDKTVKLWKISSGQLERSLGEHTDRVTCVSYSGDGQQLASGSGDQSIKLWEVPSGYLEKSLEEHIDQVNCVSYRSDGQQLASGGADRAVKLWEVASGHLERSLGEHTNWVRCVSYRGDGQQLASGSDDGTVNLWEVSSGDFERSLQKHTGPVYCVSFRGDDQQLASGSADMTVKLWEVSSGRLERSLEGHTDEVNCVSYRGDGRQLASGSVDSTIRIWNSYMGQCLHVIWGHLGSVQSVCFSPDNSLASGGSDNTVKVWREQKVRGQKVMVLHWSRGPHSFFAKGCQIKDVQGLALRERAVLKEFEAEEQEIEGPAAKRPRHAM